MRLGARVRGILHCAFVGALLFGSSAALATVYSWTGAASNLWSNPGNWSPAGVPANGDSVAFPLAPNLVNVNDLPAGTSLVDLVDNVGGVTVSGNSLVVTGSIQGSFQLGTPIDTQGNTVAISGFPHLLGTLSGTGSIVGSRLTIHGGIHPFSGTITAPLTLDGAMLPSAVVATTAGMQVLGTSPSAVGPLTLTSAGGIQMYHVGLATSDLTVDSSAIMEIDGPAAGTQYAQFVVSGTVTLTGSAFLSVDLSASFVPTLGQVFTLVANDGAEPISGIFSGMPEGTTITLNGSEFALSYVGGDGNDVTLTTVFAPKKWTGAVNNLWSEPGNWQGGVAPQNGDSVIFPAGATNMVNVNDLAPGTSLVDIIDTFDGVMISGNALVVTRSIQGRAQLGMPIDIQGNTVTISGFPHLFGALSGSGSIVGGRLTIHAGSHPFNGTIAVALTLDGALLPAAAIVGSGSYQVLGTSPSAVGALTLDSSSNMQLYHVGLATGNLTLDGSSVILDIAGPAAGTQYAQFTVTGAVTLANSPFLNLSLDAAYVPSLGQAFKLIDNDGADAVVGTFSGKPEGTVITLNGVDFQLSYVGGDGNDVTLTTTFAPKTWTGAASIFWSNPGNWTGGVPQNGDALIFPSGASRLNNFNDLPAGLQLASISDQSGSLTVGGNAIVVTGSINAGLLLLPIDVQANTVTIGGFPKLRALGGTGTIVGGRVTFDGGSHPFSGTITAPVNADGASLPAARIDQAATTMQVFGSGPSSVGRLTLNGAGLQLFHVGLATGDFTMTSSSSLTTEIAGSSAGFQYGQVSVTGAATLDTNSFLAVTLSPSFVPTTGEVFTLIANDASDPIVGTFSGKPEGTVLTLNGVYQFALSYVGGDGNDVTLTALNGKTASTTSLTSSVNPSNLGQETTLTATVTGGSPTGFVTFYDDTTYIGDASLSGGSASLVTSFTDPGTHTLTAVYSGDSSTGASTSPPVSQTVTSVDALEPETGITGGPAPLTNATTATFTFIGSDTGGSGVAGFECALDTPTFTACSSPQVYSGLASTTHTFQVRAVDGAGNRDSSPDFLTWTIDTTGPIVTIDAPPPVSAANQAAYSVSGDCSEAGEPVSVQISSIAAGGTCGAVTAGRYTTGATDLTALAQGPVPITASQTDATGNTGSVTVGTTKDTVGPTLTLDVLDAINNANKAAYAFGGNCETGGGSVSYSLVSGATASATTACSAGRFAASGVNATPLTDGTVAFSVNQLDAAGNNGTASGSVGKDTVNPTVAFDAPMAINAANQASYTISGTCSEPGRAVAVSANGTVNASPSCGAAGAGAFQATLNLSSLADGMVNFTATLPDAVGNMANANTSAMKSTSVYSPSGTIATTMPTYSWQAISMATSYTLLVQNTAGVAVNVTFTAADAACGAGTGTCSYMPGVALANNTSYAWFVRGHTSTGPGAWNSGTAIFVQAAGAAGPPAAPTLSSPSGMVATTTPSYSWNPVAGADGYGLLVQNTAGVAVSVAVSAMEAGCAGAMSMCMLTPGTALMDSTAYAWFVAAGNAYGYGAWSAGLSFTVNVPVSPAPPAAPSAIAPSGTVMTSMPTYSWTASAGASSYYLLVQNTAGVAVSMAVMAGDAGCASGSGTCAIMPGVALADGSYAWFVNASNAYGTSAWSTGTMITVSTAAGGPPAAPTLVSPSGMLATRTPMYTWNAVPGATAYYLLVQNTMGVAVGSWYAASDVGCGMGTGMCSVTPMTTLAAATDYAWFVAAWNVYGTSPWSTGFMIRTP